MVFFEKDEHETSQKMTQEMSESSVLQVGNCLLVRFTMSSL